MPSFYFYFNYIYIFNFFKNACKDTKIPVHSKPSTLDKNQKVCYNLYIHCFYIINYL